MKLSLLLQAIHKTWNGADVEISLVTDDSRKCVPGSLFVCHDAAKAYGEAAVKNGAVLVLAEEQICDPCLVIEQTRAAYSTLCRCFFGYPDRRLSMLAVTGTNGKTTVASMLACLLEMNGLRCGLLSTVTNAERASTLTTLDSFRLNEALASMVQEGKTHCVVEASSQGLQEQRLFGIAFDVAVFTNLGHDHLDIHKTFAAYKAAKLQLFSQCRCAIVNYDDAAAPDVIAACKGQTVTYSVRHNEADFTAKSIRTFEDGMDFALVGDSLIHRVKLHMQGDFNIENAMAAILAAMQCGLSVEACAAAMRSFSGVKGRMERLDVSLPFQVLIDFAHTPESLRQCLLTLRRLCKKKLILVFGCGGDRDKSKRGDMGKIACSLADLVVVTTDNPRTEDPAAIMEDILRDTAAFKTPVFMLQDRGEAIAFALSRAKEGDLVLLAGKGHETYQIIGTEKTDFDEREIVEAWAKKHRKDR